MKKLLYCVFSGLIFLSSCVQELDQDLLSFNQKIVVNGLFQQDQPFKIYVSKSFSPFYDERSEIVKNAIIKVYENDNFLGELSYKKQYFEYCLRYFDGVDSISYTYRTVLDSFYTNNNILPQTGKNYKIEVTVPGLETVSAKSSIPEIVPIEELIRDSTNIGYFGQNLSNKIPEYKIKFTDRAENNYYLFSMFGYNHQATNIQEYKINLAYYSNDPVITEYSNTTNQYAPFFSFSDVLFNGKEYQLRFQINEENCFKYPIPTYTDSLIVRPTLNNLSQDLELYIKSLIEESKMSGNPLAEPVPIYSNIENGLGIFAGFASSCKPLTIYRKKR